MALLDCWEAKFRQKAAFLDSAREAGFNFKLNEGTASIPSSTCEEFEEESFDASLLSFAE